MKTLVHARVLSFAAAALVAIGCGGDDGAGVDGGGGDAGGDAGIQCDETFIARDYMPLALPELTLDPALTDAAIDQRPGVLHEFIDANSPNRPELFVLLADAGDDPSASRVVLQMASFAGFRALGVAYVNADAVATTCNGQPDSCFGEVRDEIAFGSDSSALIDIGANSIGNRIAKFTEYQMGMEPLGNWDRYTNGGALDWSTIVIAGVGDGAIMASYIGGEQLTARVIMLGAAADELAGGTPAPWFVPASRATNGELTLALVHAQQPDLSFHRSAMSSIGLDAMGEVDVDSAEVPYDCANLLTTDVSPSGGGDDIDALGVDTAIPTSSGIPDNAPAYLYLATAP